MKLFRLLISATILTLMFGFVSIQARASAASGDVGLVTIGDVTKILQAWDHVGGIASHTHPVPGFNVFQRASITPLPSHDGAHFCVDDWHVVRVGLIDVVDNNPFSTKNEVIADLQRSIVTLSIDGVTLPGTRTPITMLPTADQQSIGFPGPVFLFQTGSILAPGAISVGDHTAGVLFSDPAEYPDEFDTSTFTVDPSGTGVCLQP